jgi:hypothetical protein
MNGRAARTLAWTTLTALVVAVLATLIGHIGVGPGYDPLALTVSDYVLSNRGLAIEVAMVALGSAAVLLAAGLLAAKAPARGLPVVLLSAWFAGLLVSAVVPTDPIGTATMSLGAQVHRYASVAAFVCLPVAAVLLASRFARTRAWSAVTTRLRMLAAGSAAGLAGLWYVAFPGDRVLIGLVERGLIAVEVALLAVLAVRVLRVASAPRMAALGRLPAAPVHS